MTTIALLPGDGIGAEILDGPVAYLRRLAARRRPGRAHRAVALRHAAAGPQTGSTLPDETVAACREADVVLSGAVGTHPGIAADECPNPEAALIKLRHLFDLRISVRTVRVPGEADVIIVRNITGGAYAGPGAAGRERRRRATPRTASCSTRNGCRRSSTSASTTPAPTPAAA